jgi:hypothetical protein
MRRFSVFAALILAGLPIGSAIGQEKLAWKLNEGDKFYIEEKTTGKQTIKVAAYTEEKEETQSNLISFHVQKKIDDGYILVQTIEELKTEVKKGKSDPNAQQLLEKMQGHQFTITLNDKGQITKFQGYDRLIDKLSNNDPDVAKLLRAILPVDVFKKTSEQAFGLLPDKSVNKGDTWHRTTNLSMGPMGSFKAIHSYKYEGDEKGLAVITSTAKLDYVAPKGDTAGLPFKVIKGNLKAENAKNRLLFDNKLGRPKQDSGSATIRGTMTMEISDMQVEMDLFIEQSSVFRVLNKRPERD